MRRYFAIATLTAFAAVSLLAQAPALLPATSLSDAAIQRELSASVAEFGRTGAFSGIVVAARGTDIIAVSTAGYANRSARTPITPSSRFTLGSMGKMFTAAAIGQLVDAGKLTYQDVVGKFFPEYANVTVRN